MRVINAIIDAIKTALTVALAYAMLAVCIVLSLIANDVIMSDEEIAEEHKRLMDELTRGELKR